jgi:hypothetical protein
MKTETRSMLHRSFRGARLFVSLLLAATVGACSSSSPEAGGGAGSGAAAGAPEETAANATGGDEAPPAPPTTPEPPAPASANQAAGYAGLAALVNEASVAILQVATGGTPDARWLFSEGSGAGLAGTPSSVAGELVALGSAPAPVMTVLEVEAIGTDAGGMGHYIRANAAVFPDGRVRFMSIEHRPGESTVRPTEGIEVAAPAMTQAVEQLISDLRGGCTVPLLSSEESEGLPEAARADLAEGLAAINETCASVAAVDATWLPRYDDISAVTRVGSRWVVLRSAFELEGVALRLLPVRLRLIE